MLLYITQIDKSYTPSHATVTLSTMALYSEVGRKFTFYFEKVWQDTFWFINYVGSTCWGTIVVGSCCEKAHYLKQNKHKKQCSS
jgi:hypothetical protein